MKNFSNIKVLALILAYSSFAMADHHASSKHDSQIKYISYSQLGNPGDVLEVKKEAVNSNSRI